MRKSCCFIKCVEISTWFVKNKQYHYTSLCVILVLSFKILKYLQKLWITTKKKVQTIEINDKDLLKFCLNNIVLLKEGTA